MGIAMFVLLRFFVVNVTLIFFLMFGSRYLDGVFAIFYSKAREKCAGIRFSGSTVSCSVP